MKTMDNHTTGNYAVDGLLLIASITFGVFGKMSFHPTMQEVYYALGSISLSILIAKNIWEWNEKIKAKRKENGK